MGWASAGAIFDPIAQALIDHGVADELKLHVCDKLIGVLQEGDWDTEGESLDQFADDPVIVQAFRNHGVYVPCEEENRDGEYPRWCDLERDHDGDHDDYKKQPWPQTEGAER